MWRMLPVENPETLKTVVRTSGQAVQEGFSYHEYRLMREYNRVAELAAYSSLPLNESINGGIEPVHDGRLVSRNIKYCYGRPGETCNSNQISQLVWRGRQDSNPRHPAWEIGCPLIT